jgi:VanZ family protein
MLRLLVFFKPYSVKLFTVWMIAIITVSSIPSLPTLKIETERSSIRLDYFIHICEYGVAAVLALMAFSDSKFIISVKKIIIVTAALILFAVIDEFHQKLIPGRSFNVKDILSNITGVAAGVAFWLIVFRRIRDN